MSFHVLFRGFLFIELSMAERQRKKQADGGFKTERYRRVCNVYPSVGRCLKGKWTMGCHDKGSIATNSSGM